eukprot:scaffold6871_cov296-Pinguiococcus_pyrenoidosus.AAC.1
MSFNADSDRSTQVSPEYGSSDELTGVAYFEPPPHTPVVPQYCPGVHEMHSVSDSSKVVPRGQKWPVGQTSGVTVAPSQKNLAGQASQLD